MNYLERRANDLRQYRPDTTAPSDLDAFWERTLKEASARPLAASRKQVDGLSPYTAVHKVTYQGFDDTPIHGWYLLPTFAGERKLPCAVIFHGYSGGKGNPEQHAHWLLQGYAVLAIDVRGQGGETGNLLSQSFGMTKGWLSQGLLDPDSHYYRAITVDALKAVEWAAQQPEIDPHRIVTAGGSQGGGLALMTAALSDLPWRTVADIPNMCHMDFGILNSTGSLTEAAEFVSRFPEHQEQVLKTLSYFDLLNLCERIRKPVFVSVGLKDTVCMPETIFAVYNRISAPKRLQVYPFNGHFTSGDHFAKVAAFLREDDDCVMMG
ncbi:alpha/beta fold hydrolase [Cohnella lubricantis]|uniref:Alpha/beta fold hydrolase n=1 Tax=Cohnella lubricantis TaxID=2163172 RepID=A0A841TA61_9BACL|nr:alpha/beta fold hydrolase [Cohnella lubricantis]MBB6676929.1 alpha/beta fold hydrolase [Cohnella lubricantis]MBP2118333.1 cephalosporin-C deacetylase [Cohnella lubricantis]